MKQKKEQLQELEPEPSPEPKMELESDRIKAELEQIEADYKLKVESGSASNTELLSDSTAIENKHIELRKTLFNEQIGGNFGLFEALNLIKQNKLPPNFNIAELPKVVELQTKIAASEELVKDFVGEVIKSKAHIENVRAENKKTEEELKALQKRLTDTLVHNNERIKEENRHIKNVLGNVIEKSPVWVAYHHPDIFRELTGIAMAASGTSTPATSERTVGAKPSDLTAEEHKQMLEGLTKEAVESAVSDGASKDSNKEIMDKIAMKLFGKTFAHYGSLDTKVYNLRAIAGYR